MSTPVGVAARVVGAAARPQQALGVAREAAEGLGKLVWAGLNPAPPTPLNVPIGPHRRLEFVRCGLAVRTADHAHQLGNRITVMRGPLPVYIEDPVARLQVVCRAMDGLKESKQAVGAEMLTAVQEFAPPTILAQASRLNFSTRLFNLIVTNVPGPQFPLYLLGRRMTDLFPIAFLPRDHALAIAIMSYDGGIDFGLLGDFDALDDLSSLAGYLEASVAELVTAAGDRTRAAGSPTQ